MNTTKFDANNLDITEFFKACHQCAVDHGWWDDKYSDADDPKLWLGEKLMLVVGECIEASAEEELLYYGASGKPEGSMIECADVVIRLADLCGRAGVFTESSSSYEMNGQYIKRLPWPIGQYALYNRLKHDFPAMAFTVPVNTVFETFRRSPSWKQLLSELLYAVYEECCVMFGSMGSSRIFNQTLIQKYEYNLSRPYRHGNLKA